MYWSSTGPIFSQWLQTRAPARQRSGCFRHHSAGGRSLKRKKNDPKYYEPKMYGIKNDPKYYEPKMYGIRDDPKHYEPKTDNVRNNPTEPS